jgi:hypothetical protein
MLIELFMMTEIYLKKRLQKETTANDQDSKNGYERSGTRQRGSTEKEGKQISK